jgi:hypothetical protein
MPTVVITIPSIDPSSIPVQPATTMLELRTSKLKRFGTVFSGVDKKAIRVSLDVSSIGLTNNEQGLLSAVVLRWSYASNAKN